MTTQFEESLARGLAQAAAGETEYLGDFTQYIEDDEYEGWRWDEMEAKYIPLCQECEEDMVKPDRPNSLWECSYAPFTHNKMMLWDEDFPQYWENSDD